MNRLTLSLGCSALLTLASCVAVRTQNVSGGQPPVAMRGGVATLYALDPLARALCFRDGREGLAFQNHRWTNRCSDLNYSLAGGGSFVTGNEVNRVGAIVDLGNPDELRERYGYEDADGGGEGFASLMLQGKTIVILKEDNPREVLQPLREGPKLLNDLGPSANAPIRLGHIYLVRLADKKDPGAQWTVKLIVVAYAPNEWVTFRWALL